MNLTSAANNDSEACTWLGWY